MGEKKNSADALDGGGGVNAVLAHNLRRLIRDRGVTQKWLEAKAGVAQATISLYLNPQQRRSGASGKEPSAKIAEVSRLANALGVQAWELLRPIADNDLLARMQSLPAERRAVLDSIVAAFVNGLRDAPVGPKAPDLVAPAPSERPVGQFIVAELKLIEDAQLQRRAEHIAVDAVVKFLNPDPEPVDITAPKARPAVRRPARGASTKRKPARSD